MSRYRENWIDNTTLEFPRAGFWFVHVIGAVGLFFMGMRFAIRRAPVSLMAYRFMRLLTQR